MVVFTNLTCLGCNVLFMQGVGVARNPPLFLAPGDMVEVEIARIGKLVNPVVGASAL
jgi:hypothetical protein